LSSKSPVLWEYFIDFVLIASIAASLIGCGVSKSGWPSVRSTQPGNSPTLFANCRVPGTSICSIFLFAFGMLSLFPKIFPFNYIRILWTFVAYSFIITILLLIHKRGLFMHFSTQTKVKMWTVSIIALLLFIVPVYFNGKWTIILGILADYILGGLDGFIPAIITVVMTAFLLLTLYDTLINRNIFKHSRPLKDIFVLSWLWFVLRIIGTVFAIMVVTETGPELITSDLTGGTMMNS